MGLTWSDAPLAAVYSRPYVVALMPNHIEIRSAQHISQQGLAQVQFVMNVSMLYMIYHAPCAIGLQASQASMQCLLERAQLGAVCLHLMPLSPVRTSGDSGHACTEASPHLPCR